MVGELTLSKLAEIEIAHIANINSWGKYLAPILVAG